MKGWAELKQGFWAAVDADPAEHARHIAALASVDPDLASRLEALLAADARGESLQQIFEAESASDPIGHPFKVGAYVVTGVLGVGGMGEVYRARDTRLKRDVALKTLPQLVASDPGRLARFQREAEVLASLNHSNIAHVHGLEESDGTQALVMEFVDGEPLSARIARPGFRRRSAVDCAADRRCHGGGARARRDPSRPQSDSSCLHGRPRTQEATSGS